MGDARQPATSEIERLREQAAVFRKRADEHEGGGNEAIARKLREVAAELEAKAEELQRSEPQQPLTPLVR